MNNTTNNNETMDEVIKNELQLDSMPNTTEEFAANETGNYGSDEGMPDFAFPPYQTFSSGSQMTPMDSYNAEFGSENIDNILEGSDE